jgi:hypothetical protein
MMALLRTCRQKPMCRNACWALRLRPKLQTRSKGRQQPGRGPVKTTGTGRRKPRASDNRSRRQQRDTGGDERGPRGGPGPCLPASYAFSNGLLGCNVFKEEIFALISMNTHVPTGEGPMNLKTRGRDRAPATGRRTWASH